MTTRSIIHVDLDAFFCTVEELLDNRLKGKPIIVGGRPEERGVVSSASYAARPFGVHSAMPTSQALRLCPNAILLPPRHDVYAEYSDRVMAILHEYTPLVEPVSIDEAFLDVTGCEKRWGSAEEIARTIQRRICDEIGLPASVGVASNKLVAKIATDLGKPGGCVVVPPGQEAEFLAPLPVERLWGVGKVTAHELHAMGVTTIGELARRPIEQLEAQFGKRGIDLHHEALGEDDSPVETEHAPKSLSAEHTFAHDAADFDEVSRRLLVLSEEVAHALRREGLQGRTVVLKLRYPNFTTITRQITLKVPTDLEQTIYQTTSQLLRREWRRGTRVRLVGVRVTNFVGEAGCQLRLFEPGETKLGKLDRTVDALRERFGSEAIQRASLLKRDT